MTLTSLLSRGLFILLAALATGVHAGTPAVPDHRKPLQCTGKQAINAEGFVPIGGIEQWITIHGARCGNPVILFLHGGPGNALSPYSESLYGPWTENFTVVQWDQRGAGKTFSRNKPAAGAMLTLEQMTADGIEVSQFLRRHLGKDKIILTGSSWGSVLGVRMAKAHPALFHAYVGVAQMVAQGDNEAATYAALREMATLADDQPSLQKLRSVGAPPWADPRNPGVVRRLTRQYEAKTTTPAPKAWWQPASGYDSPQMQADAEEADDYSYLQFVGRTGKGMFSQVDLPALGLDFHLPVFLVHGTEDLVTRPAVTRHYFDRISAPEKALVMVANAGHDPNQPFIDAQYKLMMERVRPLAK